MEAERLQGLFGDKPSLEEIVTIMDKFIAAEISNQNKKSERFHYRCLDQKMWKGANLLALAIRLKEAHK